MIRLSGGPVLFNASAGPSCNATGVIFLVDFWSISELLLINQAPFRFRFDRSIASTGVTSACPGMDLEGAAAVGVNCSVACKGSGAAFKEVVTLVVPPTM